MSDDDARVERREGVLMRTYRVSVITADRQHWLTRDFHATSLRDAHTVTERLIRDPDTVAEWGPLTVLRVLLLRLREVGIVDRWCPQAGTKHAPWYRRG